jgi:hypothetical protein
MAPVNTTSRLLWDERLRTLRRYLNPKLGQVYSSVADAQKAAVVEDSIRSEPLNLDLSSRETRTRTQHPERLLPHH